MFFCFLDRFYGSKKDTSGNTAYSVDLPHIRRLFEELTSSLSILQVENGTDTFINSSKKKISKALSSAPFGFVDLEAVSSVVLRLLRINPSSSPKQVRADKKLYEELIYVHLPDLHCLAWQVISFLFTNTQMGTGFFERELSALTRDQIKSDLKSGTEKLSKGSERALQVFSQLIEVSESFNGQVFVCELVGSSVLLDVSSKYSALVVGLLRSGVDSAESETSSAVKSKKARYHQVNESDQKRSETAKAVFAARLNEVFASFSQILVVFKSVQGHLSPQDHVSLSEKILIVIDALLKSHNNFEFISEVSNGEFLYVLVEALKNSISTFQPAYLPPFLPVAMRLLSVMAGRMDKVGASSRRALLQADLLIHPRRTGPITYRPVSDSLVELFERTIQSIPESQEQLPQISVEVETKQPVTPVIADSFAEVKTSIISPEIKSVLAEKKPSVSAPIVKKLPPSKKNVVCEQDDEDDLELPKIVESDPDE